MTDKQEQFCQEYVVDFCGTHAAIRAGYSPKSARKQASDLLREGHIRTRIEELKREKIDRTRERADRTIDEVIAIAFARMSDFLEWGPTGYTLRESTELTPEQCAAVLEVSETFTKTGVTRTIKLHPKLRALDMLMKHFGLLKEEVNVNHSGEIRYVAPTVRKPDEDADAG